MQGLEQGTKDLLTTMTIGAGGISFMYLIAQAAMKGRSGWLSAVAAPALLCGYSGFASTAALPGWATGGKGIAAMVLAVLAGVFFDRRSSVSRTAQGLQGKSSIAPLLLWGLGVAGYSTAPLAAYLHGWQASVDRASGALLAVSSCAVAGQAINWARRLIAMKLQPAPTAPPVPNKKPGMLRGGVAAAIAFLLLLFPLKPGAVATGSAVAPNLLLMSQAGPLSNGPIFIFDRSSGTSRKLDAEGSRARWSRDGTRMALVRTEPVEIRVASSDGTGTEPIRSTTGLPGAITYLAWSPDGQRIYFAHTAGFLAGDLQVVSVAGGAPQTLLPVSEGVDFPEVSPDGRSLAYFRGADSTGQSQPPHEVKVMDLATQQVRSLASDPSSGWNVTGLSWTPDGRAILVASTDLNMRQFQIERIDLDSPQRRRLGPPLDYYLSSFCPAADGSGVLMLAFPRKGGDPDPARANELWLVDPATGGHQTIPFDASLKPQSVNAPPAR